MMAEQGMMVGKVRAPILKERQKAESTLGNDSSILKPLVYPEWCTSFNKVIFSNPSQIGLPTREQTLAYWGHSFSCKRKHLIKDLLNIFKRLFHYHRGESMVACVWLEHMYERYIHPQAGGKREGGREEGGYGGREGERERYAGISMGFWNLRPLLFNQPHIVKFYLAYNSLSVIYP